MVIIIHFQCIKSTGAHDVCRHPLYRLSPRTLRTIYDAVYHIVSLQRKVIPKLLRRKSNRAALYVIGAPPIGKVHITARSRGMHLVTVNPNVLLSTYCVTAYVDIHVLYGNA